MKALSSPSLPELPDAQATHRGDRRPIGSYRTAVAFAAVVYVIGMAGAAVGMTIAPGWEVRYATPPVMPPGWFFWAVWTVLYPCIGVSGWHIWRLSRTTPIGKQSAAFVSLMAFNVAFVPVTNAAQHPAVTAGMDIVGLAIGAGYARIAGRVSQPALIWFVPALIWGVVTTAIKIWWALINL